MPRGIHNSQRSFNTVDMAGQVIGHLTFLSRAGSTPDRKARWRCLCDCGNETIVTGKEARSGHTQSCGCLADAVPGLRGKVHGGKGTRLYSIWKDMHKRCRRGHKYYEHVAVCAEWADFAVFEAWSLANGYIIQPGAAFRDRLTIDRIDGNLGYAPGNCRWTTWMVQRHNRRQLS